MNLKLKLKAARDVAGMLVLAIVASGSVQYILQNVPAETIGYVAGLGFLGWIVYILYSIRLNQLEYRENLAKMVDK